MRKQQYTKFKNALAAQKEMSFIELKKDIDNIRMFIENTLEAALESSSAVIERDFKISSL